MSILLGQQATTRFSSILIRTRLDPRLKHTLAIPLYLLQLDLYPLTALCIEYIGLGVARKTYTAA